MKKGILRLHKESSLLLIRRIRGIINSGSRSIRGPESAYFIGLIKKEWNKHRVGREKINIKEQKEIKNKDNNKKGEIEVLTPIYGGYKKGILINDNKKPFISIMKERKIWGVSQKRIRREENIRIQKVSDNLFDIKKRSEINKVKKIEYKNIIEEKYKNIESRKIENKLKSINYYFTPRYVSRSMTTQLRSWPNTIYSFIKGTIRDIKYKDILASKVINIFMNPIYLKRKIVQEGENVSGDNRDKRGIWGISIKGIKMISKYINEVIKYTSLRSRQEIKDIENYNNIILTLPWIKKEISWARSLRKYLKERRSGLISGYMPKRRVIFNKGRKMYISKPLFKHTAWNVIIDLYVYNNKSYKLGKYHNMLKLRALYKYMYSMYINYREMVQNIMSRPRIFYINIIEPKIINYYSNIIENYEKIMIHMSKREYLYLILNILKLNYNNNIYSKIKKLIRYLPWDYNKIKEINCYPEPLVLDQDLEQGGSLQNKKNKSCDSFGKWIYKKSHNYRKNINKNKNKWLRIKNNINKYRSIYNNEKRNIFINNYIYLINNRVVKINGNKNKLISNEENKPENKEGSRKLSGWNEEYFLLKEQGMKINKVSKGSRKQYSENHPSSSGMIFRTGHRDPENLEKKNKRMSLLLPSLISIPYTKRIRVKNKSSLSWGLRSSDLIIGSKSEKKNRNKNKRKSQLDFQEFIKMKENNKKKEERRVKIFGKDKLTLKNFKRKILKGRSSRKKYNKIDPKFLKEQTMKYNLYGVSQKANKDPNQKWVYDSKTNVKVHISKYLKDKLIFNKIKEIKDRKQKVKQEQMLKPAINNKKRISIVKNNNSNINNGNDKRSKDFKRILIPKKIKDFKLNNINDKQGNYINIKDAEIPKTNTIDNNKNKELKYHENNKNYKDQGIIAKNQNRINSTTNSNIYKNNKYNHKNDNNNNNKRKIHTLTLIKLVSKKNILASYASHLNKLKNRYSNKRNDFHLTKNRDSKKEINSHKTKDLNGNKKLIKKRVIMGIKKNFGNNVSVCYIQKVSKRYSWFRRKTSLSQKINCIRFVKDMYFKEDQIKMRNKNLYCSLGIGVNIKVQLVPTVHEDFYKKEDQGTDTKDFKTYDLINNKNKRNWDLLDNSIMKTLIKLIIKENNHKDKKNTDEKNKINYIFNKYKKYSYEKLINKIKKSLGNINNSDKLYIDIIKQDFYNVNRDVLISKSLEIFEDQYDTLNNSYNYGYKNKNLYDNIRINLKGKSNYWTRIWQTLNFNTREESIINNLRFSDKVFKPYYRYTLRLFILNEYKNYIKKLGYMNILIHYYLPMLHEKLNWLRENNLKILNFIGVKTLFNLFIYNYRSLFVLKPKYYYINKYRYYKRKATRLKYNTWLRSIKYLKGLRKAPKSYWLRYHKLINYYYVRIINYARWDTERKVIMPYVLYFEDILFNIYGKLAIIRIWPLKRYFLSSYILSERLMLLLDKKANWSKRRKSITGLFTRFVFKFINMLKVSKIERIYEFNLENNSKWPKELINILNKGLPLSIGNYNKLEYDSKKLEASNVLSTYLIKNGELDNYIPLIKFYYYNLAKNSYLKIKRWKKNKYKLWTGMKKGLIKYWTRPIKNYIYDIISNQDISGVELRLAGRAKSKARAFSLIYQYGSFLGAKHFNKVTHKYLTISSYYLRNTLKSTMDYTQRAGNYGPGTTNLKLWYSSLLSSDIMELLSYLIKMKEIYNALVNRNFIVHSNIKYYTKYYKWNRNNTRKSLNYFRNNKYKLEKGLKLRKPNYFKNNIKAIVLSQYLKTNKKKLIIRKSKMYNLLINQINNKKNNRN